MGCPLAPAAPDALRKIFGGARPRGVSGEEGEVSRTAAVVALVAMVSSLAPASLSAEEKNMVAARNGTQVIKYTSQRGDEWRADKLIDEQITPAGWASAASSGAADGKWHAPDRCRWTADCYSPWLEGRDADSDDSRRRG